MSNPFKWRDRIAKAVCDALRPELEQHFGGVHAHLDAATSTLVEDTAPEGTLTPDDRAGLHALRSQLGAGYNPPPGQSVPRSRAEAVGAAMQPVVLQTDEPLTPEARDAMRAKFDQRVADAELDAARYQAGRQP